ncbi:hypothetical protein [Chlorogloeopsis sp. ULAP02]|uniref:hypothetical protein n=1 Tax=Chlorogloeopsis sp. ULAP02 TaxID=3107926 RepID=UPI003134B9C2
MSDRPSTAAFFPTIRFVVVIGFIATLFFGGVAVANNQLTVRTYGFMVFIVFQQFVTLIAYM